jgi:hypothetical protein
MLSDQGGDIKETAALCRKLVKRNQAEEQAARKKAKTGK